MVTFDAAVSTVGSCFDGALDIEPGNGSSPSERASLLPPPKARALLEFTSRQWRWILISCSVVIAMLMVVYVERAGTLPRTVVLGSEWRVRARQVACRRYTPTRLSSLTSGRGERRRTTRGTGKTTRPTTPSHPYAPRPRPPARRSVVHNTRSQAVAHMRLKSLTQKQMMKAQAVRATPIDRSALHSVDRSCATVYHRQHGRL
jgi:hypothetical protein